MNPAEGGNLGGQYVPENVDRGGANTIDAWAKDLVESGRASQGFVALMMRLDMYNVSKSDDPASELATFKSLVELQINAGRITTDEKELLVTRAEKILDS